MPTNGTLNLNQAFTNVIKGQIAQGTNTNRQSVKILSTSVAAFGAATAVKIVDGTSPVIEVEKAAATDAIFGFITYDPVDNSPIAGDLVQIALAGVEMYMEAGAAIVRGAKLEIVATGDKVITSAGTNKIVGLALDKAAASGDIIKVLILEPLIAQL
ncbi:MAG: DUF2190 family protein [Flavobacterium sp.]